MKWITQDFQVVFGTFTHSEMDDTSMSDVSSTSSMSISALDEMDIDHQKIILWSDLGYSVTEVIDQGSSDCCIPAALSQCLTVGVRDLCDDKEIPCVSIQYLMDNIPRSIPNEEKCSFEEAYSFLSNNGAVFDPNYSFKFTGRRNKPPGDAHGMRVKIEEVFLIHNPTIDHLRQKELLETLENKYPVIGGIYLTRTFQGWNGKGVYYPTHDYLEDPYTKALVGHAVLIVDYMLKDNGNSIWFKIKNSYGIGWADGGHAWIDSSALIHISYPKNLKLVNH